jgi:cytohesin
VVLVGCGKPSNPDADKALFNAVGKGNLGAAKKAILDGASLNVKNRWLRTPLHLVVGGIQPWGKPRAIKNRKEIAELLISKGADVNASDQRRLTPLHDAVKYGFEDICRILIASGSNVNSSHGGSPLGAAIGSDYPRIAELLISNGAVIDRDALCVAANSNSSKVAKLLISKGANINEICINGDTPIHIAAKGGMHAARGGHIETLKVLIVEGANLNAKLKDNKSNSSYGIVGWTPLHLAANHGQTESAELLVAAGAEINSKSQKGHTPLDISIMHGQAETAIYLEKQKAKSSELNPIHLAIIHSDIESLKEQLNKSVPIESRSDICEPPLNHAAFWGREETVKILIDNGLDINFTPKAVTRKSRSPLHIAARLGHLKVAQILISHGANVNIQDGYGDTPLYGAVSKGKKEIVELLVAKGAELEVKNSFGRTVLDNAITHKHPKIADLLRKHGGKIGDWFKAEESIHIAVRAGHIEAVKKHLAAGVDVNAKQDGLFFRTLLGLAARNGLKEVAELLIANGADVNAKDWNGRTPLDWAEDVDEDDSIEVGPLSESEREAARKEIATLLRKHGGKTGEELKGEGK